MLANALRDVGEYSESTRLHRMVVESTPADPAALTDYALSLLSLGEIVKAHEQYQRALVTAPGDQTALAGIYMTSNELGMGDVVAALMDYESLLAYGKVATEDQIDLDVLRETVLKHEQLLWEPAGRSTKAGKQSPMLDLSEASPFSRFQRMITRHVERRMRAIGQSSDILGHPWLATVPRKWRLQSWITVLEEGGQQTPHIHPAGWLSGVFYVDAGSPRVSGAGDLVFGRAQQDLPLQRRMPERRHRPIGGELVMFPSYFFHNTTPYAGDGPRISLAFDVIPVER
nr:putative 2OG-Fe(II) oxygenase [Luteimonas saliphila]